MSELHPAAYRAVRRISDPDDETLADVGAICDRVPATSLRWLLEQGHIVPVDPDARRSNWTAAAATEMP